MKKEIRIRKNKNCGKVLPERYKHKYCEACRNQHAKTAKNIEKGALELVGTVGCVAELMKMKPPTNNAMPPLQPKCRQPNAKSREKQRPLASPTGRGGTA